MKRWVFSVSVAFFLGAAQMEAPDPGRPRTLTCPSAREGDSRQFAQEVRVSP